MNRNYVLSLVLFTLIALSTKGQDIHFSSIKANDMYFNPAKTAFFATDFQIATTYRNQWQSVSTNGYNTSLFTAEARLFKSKRYKHSFGIGVGFMRDVAGTLNFGQRQLFMSLSYNKQISKHNNQFISLGFQFANTYWSYDATDADFGQEQADWEGLYLSNLSHKDLSLGVHWQIEPAELQTLTAGIASFHLNTPMLSFLSQDNFYQIKLQPRHLAYINYQFPTTELTTLQLHSHANFQNDNYEIIIGGECTVDMSRTIFDQNNIGAGLYYRSNDALILVLTYQFNSLKAGISYDVNISGLSQVSHTYGGLELYISYGLNKYSYNKKIKTIPCPTF